MIIWEKKKSRDALAFKIKALEFQLWKVILEELLIL